MKRHQQGLSIIEILISIVVIGVLITTTLTVLPGLLSINRKTADDEDVTITTKTLMENLRTSWSTRSGFDAATLPAVTTTTSGFTCTATQAAQGTTTSTTIERRRVTLTCIRSGNTTKTYIVEFGRPSS